MITDFLITRGSKQLEGVKPAPPISTGQVHMATLLL